MEFYISSVPNVKIDCTKPAGQDLVTVVKCNERNLVLEDTCFNTEQTNIKYKSNYLPLSTVSIRIQNYMYIKTSPGTWVHCHVVFFKFAGTLQTKLSAICC